MWPWNNGGFVAELDKFPGLRERKSKRGSTSFCSKSPIFACSIQPSATRTRHVVNNTLVPSNPDSRKSPGDLKIRSSMVKLEVRSWQILNGLSPESIQWMCKACYRGQINPNIQFVKRRDEWFNLRFSLSWLNRDNFTLLLFFFLLSSFFLTDLYAFVRDSFHRIVFQPISFSMFAPLWDNEWDNVRKCTLLIQDG